MILRVTRRARTPAEYTAERDKALLDLGEFVHFAAKYLVERPLPDFKIIEISFHKMRTACRNLPRDERLKSHKWLTENGYQTWDDGDLNDPARRTNQSDQK